MGEGGGWMGCVSVFVRGAGGVGVHGQNAHRWYGLSSSPRVDSRSKGRIIKTKTPPNMVRFSCRFIPSQPGPVPGSESAWGAEIAEGPYGGRAVYPHGKELEYVENHSST